MIPNTFKIITVVFMFGCLIFFYCKDIETEKKIDPNFKIILQNLKDNSKLDQQISVVFKVNEDITDLHKRVLKNNKVKIIANIGHIYTASLPANKVYNLADAVIVDHHGEIQQP